MSYADVAARGPRQSMEEAAAPPIPEIVHSTPSDEISLVDVDSPHISSVPSDFESQSVKTDTQAERMRQEKVTNQHQREAKDKAEAAERKAKDIAAKGKKNADNPVVIGNAVVISALAAVLGTAGYRKWSREGLSWGLFGMGVGVIAAFGAADYWVSNLLFQRYPPKK